MIEIASLGKTYRSLIGSRTVAALQDVSLTIAQGEVVGVAGPNGAGKSTLISILLGFLQPTTGQVRIAGVPPRRFVERHGTSYLPELLLLPPRWTVESALQRHATLARIPAEDVSKRTEQIVEWLGLGEHRKKQIRQLSKGTLQRLGLAQSLIGDSDLVVFDEPTHGLDPLWTQRFRDIVRELRRPGRCMFIASHDLDELERLADRVAILHQGRLERVVAAGAGSAEEGPVVYRLAASGAAAAIARVFPSATLVEGRNNEWRVRGRVAELNRGLGELIAAGAVVLSFAPESSRLEAEFRAAVEGR
ncbi:MAG TPA: ABC transporter ATP-binding protein [Gemmatimonadales bacterium]|nr:ABC transporter ATP-binding protein [Gemmatimonadales bacterium]